MTQALERQSKRRESSTEHFDEDIIRLEKRVKDLENFC